MESWIAKNCTGCTVGCNNCLTSSMQSATLQSLSSRIPFSSGTLRDEKQIITILPSSLSSHFPLAKHKNTTRLFLWTIEKRKCQYFDEVEPKLGTMTFSLHMHLPPQELNMLLLPHNSCLHHYCLKCLSVNCPDFNISLRWKTKPTDWLKII